LKKVLKYQLVFSLIFLFQLSFASVEIEGKSQSTQTQQQKESVEPNVLQENEPVGRTSVGEDSKADSVVDDSVSKYNFILYFLYKFKYEEEEAL